MRLRVDEILYYREDEEWAARECVSIEAALHSGCISESDAQTASHLNPDLWGKGSPVIHLCLGCPICKAGIILESASRAVVLNELIHVSDLEQCQAHRNAEIHVNDYSTLYPRSWHMLGVS